MRSTPISRKDTVYDRNFDYHLNGPQQKSRLNYEADLWCDSSLTQRLF
ncbi:unnamed protein product, partial [Anisakis simplex]|uniref:Transposase n=1 Tax=Anisakis simplex TaxID=6269 RepID=A0A0M3JMS2_ANISI